MNPGFFQQQISSMLETKSIEQAGTFLQPFLEPSQLYSRLLLESGGFRSLTGPPHVLD